MKAACKKCGSTHQPELHLYEIGNHVDVYCEECGLKEMTKFLEDMKKQDKEQHSRGY